jgi:ketosteroid isomerase-like protein
MALMNVHGVPVLANPDRSTAHAAPVPPLSVAAQQLRALSHRDLDARLDREAELLATLTHPDLVCTDSDGRWLDRAAFLRLRRRLPAQHRADGQTPEVRLFGRVALVQGIVESPSESTVQQWHRATDTYLWCNTAWQLVATQTTALGPEAGTALICGAPTTPPAWTGNDPRGDDNTVLLALNENYVNAFREADVSWYDAHLSPDYHVVSGDGGLHDRAAALARFALPTFANSFKSFPVDQVSVRQFGSTALIQAQNAYELKDGRCGVSRYTDFWHRDQERWLCVAAHITELRVPQAMPRAAPN